MDVIIATVNEGRQFTIEVDFFDTVMEMKEKINKYKNIPVHRQTLIYEGQIMEDHRDTEFYKILQGAHIQLLIDPPDPRMPIVVATPSQPDTTTTTTTTTTTITTTAAAANDRHLQPRQSQSSIVVPSIGRTLQSGNKAVPAVRADLNSGGKRLQVMVLSACGTHKAAIEVNGLDKVGELKEELQRLSQSVQFPLPRDGYFFIHRQEVMEEDQSFYWHGVKQGDAIEVFPGFLTELEQ
ncbi:hypothetical protein Scep_019898 [Stephania cephalantha]|uniref:Ubiquitin-like domain-containing protein n=1 Tax=Stephania cephalantha TaxID=152367 RepID=A0AAP0IBP1_9MAGN